MSKKETIRSLFNNIAPSYDKLNHILSMGIDRTWRKKAVRLLVRPAGSMEYLDIACGTGDFTIDIARKAAEGSHITGADISEGMMDIAAKKTAHKGLSDIASYQFADCENLPFEDRTFDRISVGFGVRNFENREKGLKEVCRVMKDDGVFIILELSIPANPLLKKIYNFYFYRILPCIGGIISKNREAYTYLPDSVGKFPLPEQFRNILLDCGFSKVGIESLSCGVCHMYICRK